MSVYFPLFFLSFILSKTGSGDARVQTVKFLFSHAVCMYAPPFFDSEACSCSTLARKPPTLHIPTQRAFGGAASTGQAKPLFGRSMKTNCAGDTPIYLSICLPTYLSTSLRAPFSVVTVILSSLRLLLPWVEQRSRTCWRSTSLATARSSSEKWGAASCSRGWRCTLLAGE